MVHTRWYKKAKIKLLGTSRSPSFEAAMAEWRFTGEVEAHRNADQVCELCGKKHLQYRFRILNEVNGNALQVGSNCIRKFPGIEILDDDGQQILDIDERKKHLERKERVIRKRQATLQPLRNLYVAEKDNPEQRQLILITVKFYQATGCWPYDINHLLSRMDAKRIKYDRSCYR